MTSSNIKLKRSSVPSKVPTTAQIELGEFAVNTYDGKLYTKKDTGGTESIVTFSDIADLSTTDLSEGTNLYFTTSRANTAIDTRVTKQFVENLNIQSSTATALATARTLTIGSTGKSFDGSANVSWSLSEIGVNNSTLTLATSGIATGSQTWTSNQGSNATFTVNVPATNISQGTRTATTVPITSSTGTDATLDVANTTVAGVMSSTDKTKLDGIEAGAQVNVPTNLSIGSSTGTVLRIDSSTGTNATLPVANTTVAGVVTNAAQTFAGAKTFNSTITGSISGNAGTATALANIRTIWGQNFDGTANVTGNLTAVGNITGTGAVTIQTASNGNLTLTPNGSGLTIISNATALGGTLNNTVRVKRIQGTTSNAFYQDTYLLRDATGTDWNTSRWHDAIGVDSSFLTPRTNTRVWYERDPSDRIHEWGTDATSSLILNSSTTANASSLIMNGTVALGTQSNKATITYTTDAARIYTIPNAGENADFVMTAGNQTIGGTKTFGVDAIIHGATVGRGAGAISTNTAVGANALTSNTTGNGNTATGSNALRDNTTGNSNTAIGRDALLCNTTGLQNTATGNNALCANTTGNNNTASGNSALRDNTTGSSNTATGFQALCANTTGNNNTASGVNVLRDNTTGNSNTAIGRNTLLCNTTGCFNTATGRDALLCNTTANDNTASGYQALRDNTTGNSNTATGRNTLLCNTTGLQNTASGVNALRNNTTADGNTATGVSALRDNTTGCQNTASGLQALLCNTTGINNTANGRDALRDNTTGSCNTATGNSALLCNTTGNSNTASGNSALLCNTTGINNTATGSNALLDNTTGNNNIGIGRNAGRTGGTPQGIVNITTESNRIVMGNDDHTCAQIKIAWTATSDCRDKTCFAPIAIGLDFVRALKPTEYQFRQGGRDSEYTDGKRRYGFLAQDVLPLEGDDPVIISVDDPNKLQYTEAHLIPVLVKAIQELAQEVQYLKHEMEKIKE
jgi:hypothetical protein